MNVWLSTEDVSRKRTIIPPVVKESDVEGVTWSGKETPTCCSGRRQLFIPLLYLATRLISEIKGDEVHGSIALLAISHRTYEALKEAFYFPLTPDLPTIQMDRVPGLGQERGGTGLRNEGGATIINGWK